MSGTIGTICLPVKAARRCERPSNWRLMDHFTRWPDEVLYLICDNPEGYSGEFLRRWLTIGRYVILHNAKPIPRTAIMQVKSVSTGKRDAIDGIVVGLCFGAFLPAGIESLPAALEFTA